MTDSIRDYLHGKRKVVPCLLFLFLWPSIHIGLAFLDLYDVSRMLAVSVFQFT